MFCFAFLLPSLFLCFADLFTLFQQPRPCMVPVWNEDGDVGEGRHSRNP